MQYSKEGSYFGHQKAMVNTQQALKNLIATAGARGCKIPKNAHKWAYRNIPIAPNPKAAQK